MPSSANVLAAVCCAYECLRIVNYLSCCQLEDIQSLLVLGNVISNSMNAGVAWALLGELPSCIFLGPTVVPRVADNACQA